MSKRYKISELIMNNEKIFFEEDKELKDYKRVRKVKDGSRTKYLTWVDDKHMESITTPEGRELTPEELFDFVIGNDIKDITRSKNKIKADIAIVLGNGELKVTRERAIKAFELYRLGIVKKIIFSGGIDSLNDTNGIVSAKSLEEIMASDEKIFSWKNLTQADWGAETFIPEVYYEDYQKHKTKLTDEFLLSMGINPKDILTEGLSSSTEENALFCKNAFDIEEIETGMKINSAILVTTCTHGNRALRQFRKLFKDRIRFTWCTSTLDLEKYETLKRILNASEFNEQDFKRELKRIYCTTPELVKKLMEETANHRNAFILGDIDEPEITTIDKDEIDIEL